MKKVWKQGKRSDSMEKSQRWNLRIIKVKDEAQGSLKSEISSKIVKVKDGAQGSLKNENK